MSRLGSVALVLVLGASLAGVARAQDKNDADGAVGAGTAPKKVPSELGPTSELPGLPQPKAPAANPDAPVAPVAKTANSPPAPVSTTTPATGMVGTLPGPPGPPVVKTLAEQQKDAAKKDPKKDPNANPAMAPGYGYYGPGPTATGGQQGGGSKTQGPNTTLTFPDEGGGKDGGKADVAKGAGSAGGSSASSGGPSSSSSGSSSSAPTASSRSGDDAPGLPAPGSRNAPTPAPAPAANKKSYVEGHVVLFLRAPGDEDPSPAGVKARFTKESKVVKRIAADVQKGEKPATKPEEAVLRDAAPQGFYLPDEVDAWLVTADGALVLLEAEGQTFDKIAALALSARLNVTGPQGEVVLDGASVTKVKVIAMSTDGSEPRIDGGAGYGGGAKQD